MNVKNIYNEIREKIHERDIVSLLVQCSDLQIVKLKSNNFCAYSPFNNEKTPSFRVNKARNTFKDFSSGIGGDFITFIEKTKKLSYKEAIEYIGYHFLGINVENIKEELKQKKESPTTVEYVKYNDEEINSLCENIENQNSENIRIWCENVQNSILSEKAIKELNARGLNYDEFAQDTFNFKSFWYLVFDPYSNKVISKTIWYDNITHVHVDKKTGKYAINIWNCEYKDFNNKRIPKYQIINKITGKIYKIKNVKSVNEYDNLIFAEGIFNAKCNQIVSDNRTLSCSLFSSSNQLDANLISTIVKNKKIFHAMDFDKAGIRATFINAKTISEFNPSGQYFVKFPLGLDANDILKQYGREHLRYYLSDNKNLIPLSNATIEYEYNKIKTDFNYVPKPPFHREGSYLDIIQECSHDFTKVYEKPPTILTMKNGAFKEDILRLGGLSTWSGKEKSMKTTALSFAVAAIASGHTIYNKFIGSLPVEKNKVVWFDTEQSDYDCHVLYSNIRNMIYENVHDEFLTHKYFNNIHFLNIRKLKNNQKFELIRNYLYNFPFVGMVVVDGVRDIVTSINDEQQATRLNELYLNACDELNVHIASVLHQNKSDDNMRGHIGTELQNKSNVNIQATYDVESEMSTIHCRNARGMRRFSDFRIRYNDFGKPVICDYQ